jgi:hypothetical protein
MRGSRLFVGLTVLALLVTASAASAGTLLDAYGWHAWTTDPNDAVVIKNVTLVGNALKLEIEKDLTQTPNEYGELRPTIIQFTKDQNAVSDLIIDKETVTNHTGYTWDAFEMQLSPLTVGFDTSSLPTGSPFTNIGFDDPPIGASRPVMLYFDTGFVLPNAVFTPGQSANTGDWIVIKTPVGQAADFIIKEQAYIPEPVTVLLLTLGLTLLRKRHTSV